MRTSGRNFIEAVWDKALHPRGLAGKFIKKAYSGPAMFKGKLADGLKKLTLKEQLIVRSRMGIDVPKLTLKQTGNLVNLGPERVRVIQKKALNKITSMAYLHDIKKTYAKPAVEAIKKGFKQIIPNLPSPNKNVLDYTPAQKVAANKLEKIAQNILKHNAIKTKKASGFVNVERAKEIITKASKNPSPPGTYATGSPMRFPIVPKLKQITKWDK